MRSQGWEKHVLCISVSQCSASERTSSHGTRLRGCMTTATSMESFVCTFGCPAGAFAGFQRSLLGKKRASRVTSAPRKMAESVTVPANRAKYMVRDECDVQTFVLSAFLRCCVARKHAQPCTTIVWPSCAPGAQHRARRRQAATMLPRLNSVADDG